MRCYKCGNNLPPNSKFCQYCGEDLSNVKFCSFCGFQLKDGMKFCPQCGKDIRAIAPTLEGGHQDKKTYPDDPAVPSVGVDARDIPEPTTMEDSTEKAEKSASSPSDDSLVHKDKKKWLLVILLIMVGIIVGIFLWARDASYQKSEADMLEENATIPQTDLGDVNKDKESLTDRLYEKTAEGEKVQSDESASEAPPDYDRGGIFDGIEEDTPKASGSFEKIADVDSPPRSFQTEPKPQETQPESTEPVAPSEPVTPPEPVVPSVAQTTEATLQGIWVQEYMERQPFNRHILFKFTGNEVYYESYYSDNDGIAFINKEYGTFYVNENNSICIHTTRNETYFNDGTVDVNDQLNAHWAPRPITDLQSDTYTTSEILVYNRVNQIPPLVDNLVAEWTSQAG